MRYKKIGNTGLETSAIAIGTWGMDNISWGNYNEQESIDAIHVAIDSGINFIDTAARYGNGKAEELVGKALKDGYREKILLLTKFGIWGEYPEGKLVVHRDSSYKRIIMDCELSLKRLDVDCIDFYLQHWPDNNTPIEESIAALNELKKQGKIRFIGLCNTDQVAIQEARKYGDIDMTQMQYSMVNQESKELMQWCENEGISTVTYGSLGAGVLTGIYRSMPDWPQNDARFSFYNIFKEPKFTKCMELLQSLDKVAEKYKKPLVQVAINWSTQIKYVTSALIGINTKEIAIENCETFKWQLEEDDVDFINSEIERIGL